MITPMTGMLARIIGRTTLRIMSFFFFFFFLWIGFSGALKFPSSVKTHLLQKSSGTLVYLDMEN